MKIKTKNEIPLEIFTIKVQISRGIHMVEMMGIEPMSENPLTKLSSWTVCYLKFPIGSVNRHTLPLGSPFLLDRFKSEPPMQVHHFDDVQSEVVVLLGGTGAPQDAALLNFTSNDVKLRQP